MKKGSFNVQLLSKKKKKTEILEQIIRYAKLSALSANKRNLVKI